MQQALGRDDDCHQGLAEWNAFLGDGRTNRCTQMNIKKSHGLCCIALAVADARRKHFRSAVRREPAKPNFFLGRLEWLVPGGAGGLERARLPISPLQPLPAVRSPGFAVIPPVSVVAMSHSCR